MRIKQFIKWAKKYSAAKTGPKERSLFESTLDGLANLGQETSQSGLEQSKDKVWEKLNKDKRSEGFGSGLFLAFKKFAAVLFFFALLGLAVYNLIDKEVEKPLLVKITENGMRSTVTLSDGSTVRINENSKLEYPEYFGDKVRRVYLTGEAFFDVIPNAKKPFKVISDSTEVIVLGTSFNVNTYEIPEVTVSSGRVKVSDLKSDDDVELSSGQQAILNEAEIQVKEVNPDFFIGWHTRKLVFDEEPVASVFSILERAYGVHIELNLPKKEINCAITGTYEGERIETILLGLRHILDFNYQTDISTKTIVIKIKNCK